MSIERRPLARTNMEHDPDNHYGGKGFKSAQEEPKIVLAARIILYILGGLLIVGSLGGIGGVLYDTNLHDEYRTFAYSFWTVPALCLVMMMASGIILCISTTLPKRSTAIAWTVANWGCFWSSLMLTAVIASSQVMRVTLIFIGCSTIIQFIACLIYSVACGNEFQL